MVVQKRHLSTQDQWEEILYREGTYQCPNGKVQQALVGGSTPNCSGHGLKGTRRGRDTTTMSGRNPYDEIVVAKCIRVPLSREILCDGTTLQITVFADQERPRACVEPQDVIEQAPHAGVQQTRRLTKHPCQTTPCPLEYAVIPGDAERHLRWDDSDSRVKAQKTKEIWIRGRIKNDLCSRQRLHRGLSCSDNLRSR